MSGYKLPKDGHPRDWRGQAKFDKPRHFWLQMVLMDESAIVRRKFCSFSMACHYGDRWFAETPDADVLWLLDGRLPEADIDCPPVDAVWNRWERTPFVDCVPIRLDPRLVAHE